MGRFEKRPENPRSNGDPFGAAETALKAVTEELQIIQRNLLKSLQDDVKHLQTEKVRLAEEIQSLQENKENLQNRRQITELQELVRQLAQLLANHISTQLQSTLSTLTASSAGEPYVPAQINANTQQLLGSLDEALSVTFNSLLTELSNYQSNFSHSLSRMSLQQQQAEAIMAELVNRLTSELEKTTATIATPPPLSPELPPPPPPLEWSPVGLERETYIEETSSQEEVTAEIISEPEVPISSSINEAPTLISPPSRIPKEPIAEPLSVLIPEPGSRPPEPIRSSTPPPTEPSFITQIASLWQRPTGLLLIVLSTVVSAIYNVALKAIFLSRSQILGVFEVERLISPTLGNSLLILMLRMLVVVPLMLVLAPILHPRVWQDLQNLIDSVRGNSSVGSSSTKRVFFLSIVSGGFLFLSQVLIYVAIGQVQTGIAIALLFVYPVISGLLSSFLFRDRLNSFHIGAIACIVFGEFLVLSGSTNTGNVTGNVTLGTTTAIASGVAFALYVILTRICAAKLHPVSFTLINFATMLLLCFLALMLPYPSAFAMQVDPNQLLDLVLSAFILGVLTLVGYLLNNVGIRKFGATRSAIVGATVPALTVIIAGLIIQETLPLAIVLGVLLVTGGAAAFSFEKMRSITKTNKTTN
ncbi:MAG: EamA family transporter [Cyanomargarita calcarea GSE-NOS-MK-12-04C]|jgi:drug/metabolite transporter (DMT)-like permease|uniref:EamA family transporter n=1 Tax=Cyanomargarita calcarea GSE-NOS-MK-12-04C TaxID=2839659 RepID=A0A951QKM5_9CYAN|nr:EamA family transporter [Cyanomargarita calcarea GSE-NOS-MK-12-04C]